jgi:hypothetical protein
LQSAGTCASPARCVSVPEGWQLVSLNVATRLGCMDGFHQPEDLFVAGDGEECSCKCTQTAAGSCVTAGSTTSAEAYKDQACATTPMRTTLTVLDGGCGKLSVTTAGFERVLVPPATPPKCVASAAPSAIKAGQRCLARDVRCGDAGTCAGALPAGQRLCIEKPGETACPAGFEAAVPVGTSIVQDTRTCGACTCTAGTACTTPELSLYSDGACTADAATVPAGAVCAPVDAGVTYAAYRYSGKAPRCQPSVPSLLDGGIVLEARQVMCCEPLN